MRYVIAAALAVCAFHRRSIIRKRLAALQAERIERERREVLRGYQCWDRAA